MCCCIFFSFFFLLYCFVLKVAAWCLLHWPGLRRRRAGWWTGSQPRSLSWKLNSCQGFPLNACYWSKNRRGCAGGGGQPRREPRGQVPAKGSAPCSFFWLLSCHWPPGNAATTGSSSKAVSELALTENWPGMQLLLLRDWGCPLGDMLGSDPPRCLHLHFGAEMPWVALQTDSHECWRWLHHSCLLPHW